MILEESIKKHALLNAIRHGGKANKKAVLGKIIAENPILKDKIKELLPKISEIVDWVNSLSLEEQKKILETKWLGEIKRKKKSEKGLPPLPNADKYDKIVMRLAPFPSGPLHIGNARMVLLNDEYVKMYHGKLLLVFDDTIGGGLTEKRIFPEAYKMIEDELKWLGVKWHETYYKSDRLPIYYKYCENLINLGAAYICKCPQMEFIEKYRRRGLPCPHRDNPTEKNLEEWDQMMEGAYAEGEAVVRLKTELNHPNPAVREPVIIRISNKVHPRVGDKYHLWPLMEFGWAIDDHLLGVTHILRSKDLIKEDIIERYIWNYFGWPSREFIHYGYMMIKGESLSKTEMRRRIEKGELLGWDDPRLLTISALRRRGITPHAIRKAMLDLGLSQVDIEYSPELLYAINRKIVDPIANRYVLIVNPIRLRIKDVEKKLRAKIPLHPNLPQRGYRIFEVKPENESLVLYISNQDLPLLKEGKIVRLMDLLNVKIEKITDRMLEGSIHSYEYEKARELGVPLIHWLPVGLSFIKVKLVMPDASIVEGIGEELCKTLRENQIVQFIRVGFARIDAMKDEEIVAYYAHS